MKKRTIALALGLMMLFSLLTGCQQQPQTSVTAETTAPEPTPEPVGIGTLYVTAGGNKTEVSVTADGIPVADALAACGLDLTWTGETAAFSWNGMNYVLDVPKLSLHEENDTFEYLAAPPGAEDCFVQNVGGRLYTDYNTLKSALFLLGIDASLRLEMRETPSIKPEATPAPTTEEDRRREWEEWNRIQQENGEKLYGEMLVMQDEMIAFFEAHREEFETFAFLLHDLDASDPDYTYLYAVDSNSLFFFDGTDYRSKGEITDHPILSSGEFLRDSQTILFVEWNYSSWFEQEEMCCFGAEVPDELNDGIYAELYIFYSENEPVPNEYREVTELAPHWYYYDEFKE